MDSPAQESSSGPSSRGLKSIFKKGRKGGKENDSNTSFTNTLDDSSSGRGAIRTSVDSALDKLRSHASEGQNAGDEDGSREKGIARLLPGRKRRRRKRREAQLEDGVDEPRGRDGIEQAVYSEHLGVDSPSRTTLDDDGDSSLLTYDSELDS